MSFVVKQSQAVPLVTGADGVVFVGATRVTLDTIAHAFSQGATAEEIAQQYPAVALADIYSVIGYLLHHQGEVDAYLAERSDLAREVRKTNEERFDSREIRARLAARHPSKS